jgi:acyl-CoA reductase-like NAD-dependent aldehyde dehydrogenase
MHINGKDIVTASTFDVIAPATGKVIHKCVAATPADAVAAVEAAAAAFPAWRATLPAKKRDIFLKAADILDRRAEEVGRYMEDETGATAAWAGGFNVPVTSDGLRDVAGRIATLVGEVPTIANPGRRAMVVREPFGVILGIAPWNAPFILGFRAVSYAIAAGNTAVLKATELSPRCSHVIASVFQEAGLPDGVLNVIAHRPADAIEITKTLIEHKDVKKVNFTGSTPVGKAIAEVCGRNLKPVLLELGGKAPAIVWEDADLEMAATQCAVGAFLHAGQICMATERIIVHEKVAEEFGKVFGKTAEAMFGSQAQVLISKNGVVKNKALVKDAVEKGAKVISGDPAATEDIDTAMKPVIISGVTPDMSIYSTESFGPTVSLLSVSTVEEALRIANDTEYGLSSSVFTRDLRLGLRFAEGIETGAVHVNSMSVHDEPGLPHGGAKSSGWGRFGSLGLGEWVRTKTITYDH